MVSHPKDPSGRRSGGQALADAAPERVARVLARAGVASRREAERLIEAGRVALNGQVLTSPAVNIGPGDILTVDGAPIADREPPRMWRYHKPAGLLTSHADPKGRPTVFSQLPKDLPRVISVGRLDFNSEGLLLLTNDGAIARQLELPSSGVSRRYRARAYGRVSQDKLDRLKDGITVEGVAYGPIEAELERGHGSNVWIGVSLSEGKNREVRKVLEAIGLKVNRLIRVTYGPFELGDLAPGEVEEVPARRLKPLILDGFAGEPPPSPKPRPGREDVQKRAKPPQSPRGDSSPRGGASRFKPTSKPKPRSSPSGGSPRAAGDGGNPTAKPAGPKTYKAGWARPKLRAKPSPPKAGGSKRRR